MDLSFERRAWTLVYVCLGIVEGGTAAVMVRALFVGAAPGMLVDLVLAMVSAAPAWSNLASLAFARRVQGQPKIGFLQPLLLAMTVCVAALALLPGERDRAAALSASLWLRACAVVRRGHRSRGAVERELPAAASGPDHRSDRRQYLDRARSGRSDPRLAARARRALYRVWILVAAGCGLAGSIAFRRFRVRNEETLLAAERARLVEGASFSLGGVRELLARDASFRRYMYAMSLFGAGNLTLIPCWSCASTKFYTCRRSGRSRLPPRCRCWSFRSRSSPGRAISTAIT
jgi:hypothetical protein